MANSVTNLDLLTVGQSGKETTVNALVDPMSPSAFYGRRANTTMALTWGYYGGNLMINSTIYPIANGTVTLTNNADNYLEMSNTDGSLSINTTGFSTSGKTKLYKITTANNLVTVYTDYRAFLKIASTDTYTLPVASTTVLGGVKVDGTTITADANGVISSVAGSSGVSQIIAGTNVTITPSGGTGAVTINASGGGSSSLATAEVFSVTAKSGLTATIQGGRCSNIGGRGLYNNVNAVQNVATTTVTLPINSSGFVVYRNASAGSIGYVTTANLASEIAIPLYYFVTSTTAITTFDDVRKSFSKFNMNNPVVDLIQTSWAVSSSYSFSVSFPDIYRSVTPLLANILCERIQLLCVTAELGYAVNDITCAVVNEPSVVISPGNVKILTQPSLPQILNRTTLGTISTITPANWKLLVSCKPVM